MVRNKPIVESKAAGQEVKMGENPTWVGAMGVVSDWDGEGFHKFMGELLDNTDMTGGKGWLVSCRDGGHRMTPTGMPLLGVPCIVTSLTQPVFLHGCRTKLALDQGISFANFEPFLASESGDRFLQNSTWLVRLPVGCSA